MEQTLQQAVEQLVPASRQEPPCLSYVAYPDPAQPGTIRILEIYTDRAGFEAHVATDHFKNLGIRTGPTTSNCAAAHSSIQALEKDIRDWITNWNDSPKPFAWTKTADEILGRRFEPRPPHSFSLVKAPKPLAGGRGKTDYRPFTGAWASATGAS